MMNQEKLKGHLLILAANILFAINMPVSKYLQNKGNCYEC